MRTMTEAEECIETLNGIVNELQHSEIENVMIILDVEEREFSKYESGDDGEEENEWTVTFPGIDLKDLEKHIDGDVCILSNDSE